MDHRVKPVSHAGCATQIVGRNAWKLVRPAITNLHIFCGGGSFLTSSATTTGIPHSINCFLFQSNLIRCFFMQAGASIKKRKFYLTFLNAAAPLKLFQDEKINCWWHMGIYTKEKIVHHHSKERREFLSEHNMDEKCHTTQKMMSNYFVPWKYGWIQTRKLSTPFAPACLKD